MALWLVAALGTAISAAPTPTVQPVDFARDVQPLLSDRCVFCHGPDAAQRKAKLRLDTRDGVLAVRDGRAAVVPGKPERSEIVRRILSDDPDERMPPPDSHRVLSPAEVDLLRRWVAEGAPWSAHWSLVAPQRPALPDVADPTWCRNPIDRFILARLEKEKLRPTPVAPKEALIRRVSLDLTGLPPTLSEVEGFVADESPDAYDQLVDRLLASPRYGERMVWEWLDAARYADTNGYQGDSTRTMWPWRDWAVKAFNDDMPFDRFTVEQIAGDLLPNATSDQRLATAFCRNHPINGEGGRIPEENRVDYVMDQAETVGTVWLGLTVGCARCHDHKFDPFTQKDYYSLFAFFNNTPVTGAGGSGQTAPVIDFATPEQKAAAAELSAEAARRGEALAELEKTVFPHGDQETAADSPKAAGLSGNLSAALKKPPDKRSVDDYREFVNYFKEREPAYAAAVGKLKSAMEKRDAFNAAMPRVMVMEEMRKPREAFVLVKGAYDKHADAVTANTPGALPPLPADAKRDRLALANWLVSPEHPLTARVTVNRLWQQVFGIGLVKTAEDFGLQGERPVNPELLDWLAVEFRESGWDVKRLMRLMVTSAAYRQSSRVTPELFERDPENRLLARGPRFRMPAFMLRDQALAAAGLLTEQVGGPPVKPYQPAGIWEEATFGKVKYQQDHGPALYRRSLYTFWRRIVGPTEFFDTAARQVCTVKPARTNTPLQALTLLNDTTFVEAARVLAGRVMTDGGSTPTERLNTAYRIVLSRRPSAEERAVLLASLERLKSEYAADRPAAEKLLAVGEAKRDEKLDATEHAAYTGLCLAIMNLDEAVTKE